MIQQAQQKKTVSMIGHNANDFEKKLSAQKKSFTVKMSNYTTIIETDKFKYIFNDDFSQPDFRFLEGYKKIKSDIEKIAPHIDTVNEKSFSYFGSKNGMIDLSLKRAYNVDIKSAYLTCAKNFGFISQDTFDFCMQLKKADRLKAFGMIATNYTCFDFVAGDVVKVYAKKDEHARNYFFAVCSEISFLMNTIRAELSDGYLFHWVDGIYFSSEKSAIRCQEIISQNNFTSSFDVLHNFKLKTDDFRYIIEFGKSKEKKLFTIPIITSNPEKVSRVRMLTRQL